MRNTTLVALALIAVAAPAAAQSRQIYIGASAGANGASRGPIQLGDPVWTTGGLVGLRLSGAWSVEVEVDRGFASSERFNPDGPWIGYAPRDSTPAERERLMVRAQFRRIDTARGGYSVQAVWKSREPGSVNVALYGGVSWRHFDARVIRTITHVPDDPAIPLDDPNVRDADDTNRITGGGYTAGLMIPVRVRNGFVVAPDVRLTLGLITDESAYKSLTAGVRVMWGF